MGIFDAIKSKFKKDDISDIRSHVIGDSFDEQNSLGFKNQFQPNQLEQQNQPPEQPTFRRDTVQGELQPFDSVQPPKPKEEPLKFENDLMPESEPRRESRNYETNDRLNMIESQLSAIRSQTETINERLKNIELKLSRRY